MAPRRLALLFLLGGVWGAAVVRNRSAVVGLALVLGGVTLGTGGPRRRVASPA